MTKNDLLKEIGGEPLEGSGYEDDTPDPDFSDDDTLAGTQPPAPRE